MKYSIIIVLSLILGFLIGRQFCPRDPEVENISYIMEKSIQQVGKLIVTEAEYSQMFTEKSADKYLFDLISIKKKAVILGTADVQVEYDLHKIKYLVDDKDKIIKITYVPDPILNYHYDFQWFDIDQSRLNQFSKEDLNNIQDKAKQRFNSQIDQNALISQGHKRLIEELKTLWSGLIARGWHIEDMSGSKVSLPSQKESQIKN